MKKWTVIVLVISSVLHAQKDTLSYNELKITLHRGKAVHWYNNQKFNGILKIYLEDQSACYEKVRDGIITSKNCIKTTPKEDQIYSVDDLKYPKDVSVDKKELTPVVTKIYSEPCKNCDYGFTEVTIYYYKNTIYSGIAKSNDSIFQFQKGMIKEVKIYYPNRILNEVITFEKDKKNGMYRHYDQLGTLTTKGNFKSNRKEGEWVVYNQEYDSIVQNYHNNLKHGNWYYYKKNNVVKNELYQSDQLDSYNLFEYENDITIQHLYRNDKKYAVVKYKNQHIISYEKQED